MLKLAMLLAVAVRTSPEAIAPDHANAMLEGCSSGLLDGECVSVADIRSVELPAVNARVVSDRQQQTITVEVEVWDGHRFARG